MSLVITPYPIPQTEEGKILKKYAKECIKHMYDEDFTTFPISVPLTLIEHIYHRNDNLDCDDDYKYHAVELIKTMSVTLYVDYGLDNVMRTIIDESVNLKVRRIKPKTNNFFVMISGKRCCGKDTTAELLAKHSTLFDKNTVVGLGYYAKKMFAEDTGHDFRRILTDYEYKNSLRPEISKYVHNKFDELGPLFCVNSLLSDAKDKHNEMFLVPDCRYVRELEPFKQYHSTSFVHIIVTATDEAKKQRGWAYDEKIDTDPFETSMDDYDGYDIRINNDGTFEELEEKVIKAVELLGLKKVDLVCVS